MNKLKKLKVLLVEDEFNLSKLLQSAIGEYFAEFIVAYDGVQGIEEFENHHPHIIISDITMPKMSGLEMAKEIHKKSPKIPIVILSAYSHKEVLLDAIESRVIKYFIKPFDPDELLGFLQNLAQEIVLEEKLKLDSDFMFDIRNNKLYKGDSQILLTKRELLFFSHLLRDKYNFVASEELKCVLWNDSNSTDESLRTFVKRLRQKTSKRLIQNNPIFGYKIALV